MEYLVVPIFVGLAMMMFPFWPMNRIGAIRSFCCWVGWHSWGNFDTTGFDGCSVHARCKWCEYEGMIDSQGNLF